jgi:tetratricopeptide (TPR) repeat protein
LVWEARAQDRILNIRLWAEQASAWNFKHKLLLMEAEVLYSYQDFEQAKELYKQAISSARSHKYINDEALSCELAAKFYFDIGDLESSLEYYKLAHEKYCLWGAGAKANQLFTRINETFADFLIDGSPVPT